MIFSKNLWLLLKKRTARCDTTITKEEQEKLYNQVLKYKSEYKNAIKILVETNDINEVLSPLTTLIMQHIENELKAIVQDYFEIKETAEELHMKNHECQKILKRVEKKYSKYLGIDFVNNQFLIIKECLKYLKGIYGKDTMINARYPIDSRVLTINKKTNSIDSEEYKYMFTKLQYALKSLENFYELEKVYKKIEKTANPVEQLNDFIDYCNIKYENSIAMINEYIIKEIDKHNSNILKNA